MASLADEKLINSPNARTATAEQQHSPEWHIINATIERCAQWLEDNYSSARTIAFEMRRALKQ